MTIFRAPNTPGGQPSAAPDSRSALQEWIQNHLQLSVDKENELLAAIDAVLARQERRWEESKQDALRAIASAYSGQASRLQHELSERDRRVSSIGRYFEDLVASLTDQTHRDPKTRLINFGRFVEQLEAFLTLEQRGTWCAVGLVDINSFKSYNDRLGHAAGDRIIGRVARLLSEHARAEDIVARDGSQPRVSQELHARFGGDEFCFLVPRLVTCDVAGIIGDRFQKSVERYDWATEDPRLAEGPVRVDVGIVCLQLGPVTERRSIAGRLAHDLLERADELMYAAKSAGDRRVRTVSVRIEGGALVDIADPA